VHRAPGAEDFLSKPIDMKDLDARISRILERQVSCGRHPRSSFAARMNFSMLFRRQPEDGRREDDPSEKVADHQRHRCSIPRRESGTGQRDGRAPLGLFPIRDAATKPFVKVNCAAISRTKLLESELFGYEQGAFTGANRQKLGKFDVANSGTIFLDEISEMHPALQAKLLHVLQDGEFGRLGR